MSLPQGVWSLKDALSRRDKFEKEQSGRPQRSKRKKIIEINDDESDTRGVKKVKTRPVQSNNKAAVVKSPPNAVIKSSSNSSVQSNNKAAVVKSSSNSSVQSNNKAAVIKSSSNASVQSNNKAAVIKSPPNASVQSNNKAAVIKSPPNAVIKSPTNVSATDAKELEKQTKVKTRKPPKKRHPLSSDEECTEEDDNPSKKFPREAPPMRKSPRIRSRVILLDSDDSGPELLPVPQPSHRQPLKTTENTSAPTRPGPGKRRKVVKKQQSLSNTENTPLSNKTSPLSNRSNGLVVETSVEQFQRSSVRKVKELVEARPSPPLVPTKDPPKNQTNKGTRKRVPKKSPPDVVRIPDSLTSGRKKVNITSKVVKIKKPAAVVKKNQGPVKAGATPPLPLNTVIVNSTQKTQYVLDKVLGSGGFGYIYIVSEDGTKRKAVMKVEPQDNGPLFSEMHFYQRAGKSEQLQSWTKSRKMKYLGIPEMYGFGIHLHNNIKFRYLVMPLFDGDLLKKHKEFSNKFSIQTTMLIIIRMLEALQYVHEAGYVHADVKSANILLKNNQKEVYLADFGLARKYTMDGKHKQYREEPAKAHDGTKEYTSIDAHKGVQPSRRGDLQILAYCCVNWLGGDLPWFSWDNCNNIKAEKIKYEKTSSDLLESSLGLANLSSKPWKALKSYLSYAFSLGYEDTPKYSEIITFLVAGLSKSDSGYVTWS